MRRFIILTTVLIGITNIGFSQVRFDRTSGKKIYLDQSKYEGTWISKKNPEGLKINILFGTKHFKEKIINYYADYFIVNFLKFNENGVDLTKKYPRLETFPIVKEDLIQRVNVVDPRAEVLLKWEFKPLENGDLLLTPHRWEISFQEPKGPYLFEPRKAIVLTRVRE